VAADATGTLGAHLPELSGRPVLDPSLPFGVHSTEDRAADTATLLLTAMDGILGTHTFGKVAGASAPGHADRQLRLIRQAIRACRR